jgi:serine/threonine protein kinase
MATSETAAGTRVVAGRYRLLEQLGRGGMGVVWAGHDDVLQRPVAVKEVLYPPGLSDEEYDALRERTLREARIAAQLDHPCAVRVFDVCEDEGRPFIVMELLVGRTLSDAIRADGPTSSARAAEIGLCVLDALTAAHGAGIVHRDVKPANVMLREDGRVALTDFGIASTAGDPSLTSTGLLLGSPAYISPERARGGTPEPAADLWSLGATLYTAVEGHPPFDRPDPIATLTAVATEPPEPCRNAVPELARIIASLLDKDPAARPAPDEVRARLVAVSADPQAQAVPELAGGDERIRTGGHTVVLPAGADVLPAGPEAAPDPDATSAVRRPPGAPSVRALLLGWAALLLVVFGVSATIAALVAGR